MRIAFVSPPFAGHLNPQIPLARAARASGYAVEFVTGERKWPVLSQLGYTGTRLPSLYGDRLERIANWPRRVGSNPVLLWQQFRLNLELLPALRRDLVDAWRARPPHLVVADSVAAVAGPVCDEMGIPWITTIATPFAIEGRGGVPAYCGGWSPGDRIWHRARDAAGRAATHAFKSAVAWRFGKEFRLLGFGRPYRGDGEEAIYSPRAILGFGIRELEFERHWPRAFRMIGAVIESPETCPPIAYPSGGRRVLVTLGTHLTWAKKKLVEHVISLAKALPGIRFVVSLGSPQDAGGPAEEVSGVLVCPFVPYHRDLAEFDAVVHHGGAGIVYAAILAGIPSLVSPRDYDQFDYAARLAHHRLGLRIKSLEARKAREALVQLLDRRAWPEVGRFQRIAASYRPAEEFLAIVREIIGAAGQ